MCRLLFLDIDGVLNSTRSLCAAPIKSQQREEWAHSVFDPIAVALINRLVADHDLEIVISSSHRQAFMQPLAMMDNGGPDGDSRIIRPYAKMDELRAYMAGFGLNVDKIRGVTPDINFPGRKRGHEIQYYLNSDFEWSDYAIVDDVADMLPEQLPRFIQTTLKDGLTFDCYARLEGLFSLNGIRKPRMRIPNLVKVDWQAGTITRIPDDQQ